jgi:hypothetical protein
VRDWDFRNNLQRKKIIEITGHYMLNRFLTALVLALFIMPAFAWDYAQDPLAWIDGSDASPNVALMIDDSTSMHYQVVSESYQRVKSGMDSFTISPWYVCTNYNNSTKRCTSVFATALADMAGVNTANPTETGITVYQDSLGATVPRYVYQGNGNDDEVPGAALCNVHKNPGDVGFYLGKSGSSWLASAAASDIGVLVSKSTSGTGTNDACVRWKLATTGMVGGVDEYTAYQGDYASFLLTKHAGSTPRSLNFSDAITYPDIDPDIINFIPSIDGMIIPNITRLESARQLSQAYIQDNYKRAQIGLFSLDSEMDRACGDGSNPEADKTALLGLVSEFRATELGSPLARTQTKINNYFKGSTSPIRYRCQKNFSVVVTDGEPDNDTGTLDGAAQTGYDTDAKTSGNDLGGTSWNDPGFGSRWVKQNVITHTVGLGLENNLLKRTPLVDRITVPPTNIISNAIRIPAHGLFTGSYIEVVSGAAPGLSNGNFYYVAQIDADRFKLADTKAKAFTCAANTTADCISFASGGTNMTISTGSGKSFFLNDMDGVSAGLSEDMASIYALSATVAIATNSKNIDAGSLVYQAKFNTEDWSGEIVAYRPNAITGEVNTYLPPIWTTKTTLDSPAERGTLLTWNRDANAGAPFTSLGSIGATQSALLNNDINVLNWLRGLAIFTPGFRDHSANGLMGDVINSNVLYVGAEDYGYSQLPAAGNTGAATYNAFVASNATRNPMLFVGANDGMLHGFNANSGAEKIAFIPSGVYEDWNDANKNTVKDAGEVEKKLFNLTQENYEHRLFVDGVTTASDAYIGNAWKTYLVGGLGAGGRSVYALDITDDTFSATDVKWEFSHSELGRTYGTPIIARFADNQWYAVFANGPDSASGKASVFIVNLANPADYHILTTNTGSAITPNGMMTVQVKFDTQHTASAIYAGDLQGHIWKFDVHTAGAFPGGSLLFNAKDSTGMQQPITGGITLGEHPDGLGTMVYFGTGKYFETVDKDFNASSVPQGDSFYGVLDSGSINITRSALQAQFLNTSGFFRTASTNWVNYPIKKGWYVDLLNNGIKEGERVITNPMLDNNHIIFSSQVSSGDACASYGLSYLNVLDALSGGRPDESVLDTNSDGVIDSGDQVVSSIKLEAHISAPVLINNGVRSYALLNSLSSSQPLPTVVIASPPAVDTDGDGLIDSIDTDDDGDGVPDVSDAFPDWFLESLDTDHDGIANTQDLDDDNDGIDDADDSFPLIPDGAGDFDNDGIDNNSDTDDDNDGVPDISDLYPFNPIESGDVDSDGVGNNVDTDDDNDGVPDTRDRFPLDASESADNDNDGTGNNADTDDDNDGVPDISDRFSFDASEFSDADDDGVGDNADDDSDNDGVPDATDRFPLDPTEAYDSDNDGIGNSADTDDDNDGVPDTSDAFPLNAAESADNDNDGIGNNADADDDNDGVPDVSDVFPFDVYESADNDNDGIGNKADADDDNDGVKDYRDAFPFDATESVDTDGDGIGNNADSDDDDDGVEDINDAFPLDAFEAVDTDGDGIGDNSDADDDNDGVDDENDAFPFDSNESVDTDADGIGDNSDNCGADANADQLDTDGDANGDVCDSTPNGDDDSDDVDNATDNCLSVFNTDQLNADGDSEGDECDSDDDNDNVADSSDAFPLDATESVDTDSDTVGDNADNCVAVANTNQLDTDTDGAGDVCDSTPNGDTDNDGIDNAADNCPLIANSNQLDYDADNIGDACDDAVPLPEDIVGVIKNAKAGSAVAFAGDVNGDGYGDYVVGMPGYDIPAAPPLKTIQDAGRAEVISGKTGAVLMSVNGVAAKDAMGFAVAGNGDIDNDGFDDVLVGAPNADDFAFGVADAGSATILFGPDGIRTKTFIGKSKKSLSGSAVALADVNGDNHADIIIGAPKADDVARSLTDAGNVTVISGNNYAVLNTLYVAKAKANAGTSVAAGDINHDGKADIIIGAPNDDDATNNLKDAGSVSVYDISGTELMRKYGAVANAHFGKAVASGDVNNDGVDDVLVGAPDDDNAKLKDAGSVTVFSGSDGSPLVKKFGAATKINLGNSVAAGDVNADGYADIIAGAWKDNAPTIPKITKDTGSVSVWSGNGYALIDTVYGDAANDYFGAAVSAGDVNSDGKFDLIIGIPGFDTLLDTKPVKEAGGVKVLSGAGL